MQRTIKMESCRYKDCMYYMEYELKLGGAWAEGHLCNTQCAVCTNLQRFDLYTRQKLTIGEENYESNIKSKR